MPPPPPPPVNHPTPPLTYTQADLRNVDAFPSQPAVAALPAIHLLVLNAGIMALPKLQRTQQGFEAQWGTNHVGHQHLTQKLLPRMLAQVGGGQCWTGSRVDHTCVLRRAPMATAARSFLHQQFTADKIFPPTSWALRTAGCARPRRRPHVIRAQLCQGNAPG